MNPSPRPGVAADGRRIPTSDYFSQLIAPPDHQAELARGFTLLCSLRDGRIPAREVRAAVRRAELTAVLDDYRDLARALADYVAAVRARAAETRHAATPPGVLGPAIAPASSVPEEITTSDASRLYGLTAVRWQQLAVAGGTRRCRIRARKDARNVWWLSRADVIAYIRGRSGRDPGGSEGPGGPAGDPGRPPGGCGAAGSAAA
jgi:hypothetical protein